MRAPSSERLRVLVVFGTRPEAIKMAALIAVLRERPQDFDVRVCVTSQHRAMLDQGMAAFGLDADFDLDLMRPDQGLAALTSRVLEGVSRVVAQVRPDWVVVQGDTTTSFAAALAAFYARVPVAHVEAGLRTGDLAQPFPEELNRRAVDLLARLCLAPTERAAATLRAEGVEPARIVVTGNTGIDALRLAAALGPEEPGDDDDEDLILVTVHRRESFGAPLECICDAVAQLAAQRVGRARVVLPVHPNPRVSECVRARLVDAPNVTLCAPLDYVRFARLLARARLVLTDSGGVQEEAASLGVPALVLRERTEREEGLDAGNARLVGTDPGRIVAAVDELLDDPQAWRKMAVASDVYGDGHASERIRDALLAASEALPCR